MNPYSPVLDGRSCRTARQGRGVTVLDDRVADSWQRPFALASLRFRGIEQGCRRMANEAFHFTLIPFVSFQHLAVRL